MPAKKQKRFVIEPPKKSILGLFQDPAYISTAADKEHTDPYMKEEPIPTRYLGKSMSTAVGRSGHGPDAYFDRKFHTLASESQLPRDKKSGTLPKQFLEATKYRDPGKEAREAAMKAKEKNIDKSKGWVFASPPKASTGPGSYVGSFCKEPFKHMPEYVVLRPRETKENPAPKITFPQPQPPNMKCFHPKKGSFGVVGPHITFSKPEPPKVNEVFDIMKENDKKAWAESKKAIDKISKNVFRTTCRTVMTFDEKKNQGVSSVFDTYPAFDPSKPNNGQDPPKKAKTAKKGAKAEFFIAATFKPAHVSKSGESGFLNKFANATDKPNPQDKPPKEAKESSKKGKGKEEPKALGGPWKPVSHPKGGVTRSLLRRFF